MAKRINAVELKAAAEGRWLEILGALAPALHPALEATPLGRHVACPVHKGQDGDGLRVFANVADTGGTVCNTCGFHPDGLETLQWVNGWSFRETLEEVDNYLGGVTYSVGPASVPAIATKPVRSDEEDKKLRDYLNRVWAEAVPLTHPTATPARRYFASRGLPLPAGMIRFHKSLTLKDKGGKFVGKVPGVLSLITTSDSRPQSITLHRTFLTPDGRKISEAIENVVAKKLMSVPKEKTLAGASIRLGLLDGFVLGVAEGVETALAASVLHGIPVWAAANAWMLEEFIPPEGITKVIVFADKDRSGRGEVSARKLVENLWKRGIHASIALPELPIEPGKKGVDWADALLA